MSQRSRGRRPKPAPPAPTGTVDIGAVQDRIADQLQEAEGALRDLDAERERVRARIWALRGQLELTMELSRQVSAPAGRLDGLAPGATAEGATITDGIEPAP